MSRSPVRSVLRTVEDAVLTVLSVLGVLCIVAVICAFAFDITLIMFRTGSMSPTIPTGSLAIVRELPASEVHVGDVTTIDRPGQLPVTHRVTSITPAGGDLYSITMKGDANDQPDAETYTVTTVRKVYGSLPGAGYLVARAQNPKVMAATTLLMAALVTWAFWPRRKA